MTKHEVSRPGSEPLTPDPYGLTCPVPHSGGERVLLAHGEGALLARRLIGEVFLEAFDNDLLRPPADAAVLPAETEQLAFTTDSYVVSPRFFPGGDIGKLAVHGTVNDLAVCGAVPLYLSLGLIVEEGLALAELRRVVRSVAEAAADCGVRVVTGDTKVVPRGAADGLFVNTAGVGRLRRRLDLGAHRVAPGDRVLVSGTIGDHGMAVLAAREGFDLGDALRSDTAPLHGLVEALELGGVDVRFLRDPTRGGVSAVLHELAEASGLGVVVDEAALPVSEPVRGACELLGLDPLFVANEGKLVAICSGAEAQAAVDVLRRHPLGAQAAVIGEVVSEHRDVLVRTPLGHLRPLDEPTGAPLPRIC